MKKTEDGIWQEQKNKSLLQPFMQHEEMQD